MQERITVDAHVHFGKPCLAGTRIPVLNILEQVREGFSSNDIIRQCANELWKFPA